MYFLLLCPYVLYAQQPAIRIKGEKAMKLKIAPPIAGAYFVMYAEDTVLNTSGELLLPNRVKAPALYTIDQGKPFTLLVQPGKSYDLALTREGVTVEGGDAAGQQALNQLQLPFYQTAGMSYYKADTVFANNKQRVLKDIDSSLAPFKKLLNEKQITNAFYTYTEQLLRAHYANVLAVTLLPPLMKVVPYKDSTGYDVARLKQYESQLLEAFSIADPKGANIPSLSTGTWYSLFYTEWYLRYLQPAIKGTYQPYKAGEDGWMRDYELVKQFYKGPAREYMMANLIYILTQEMKFEAYIPTWYDAFKKEYPKSGYTTFLQKPVQVVRNYHAKATSGFAAGQQFVDNPEAIKSVAELAQRFKGKTVYLDLWATWCGPCKAQFAYNDGLKAFLKEKGGEVLYVSIDADNADKRWKEMIIYYDLQGSHIRASKALREDITKVFGNKGSLSIPRYAVIKDGKLVLDRAKQPEEGEKLYEQLGAYF